MNKIFDYNGHKRKWFWLYNNPDKNEKDWPEWNNYKSIPLNYCFACEYSNGNCEYCPLGGRDKDGKCLYGLVKLYKNANRLSNKSLIALIISRLPLKQYVRISN